MLHHQTRRLAPRAKGKQTAPASSFINLLKKTRSFKSASESLYAIVALKHVAALATTTRSSLTHLVSTTPWGSVALAALTALEAVKFINSYLLFTKDSS